MTGPVAAPGYWLPSAGSRAVRPLGLGCRAREAVSTRRIAQYRNSAAIPPASRNVSDTAIEHAVTCADAPIAASTARSPSISLGPPIDGGIIAAADEKSWSVSSTR